MLGDAGTPDIDKIAAKLKAAVGAAGAGATIGSLVVGSDLTYQPAVFQLLAETLRSLAEILQQTNAHILIAHDDASHPGCPYHRATFFGSDGKLVESSGARSRHVRAVASRAPAPCAPASGPSDESGGEAPKIVVVPTLRGGILQSHGFLVEPVDLDEHLLPSSWQVSTVHVFRLTLEPGESDS